jgi:hypothetical protein
MPKNVSKFIFILSRQTVRVKFFTSVVRGLMKVFFFETRGSQHPLCLYVDQIVKQKWYTILSLTRTPLVEIKYTRSREYP